VAPYLLILSGWGALLTAHMWWIGPWLPYRGAALWLVQVAAVLSCAQWYRAQRSRTPGTATTTPT
jgi:hypothetical protein